jgi:hypothetical protein
MRTDNAADIRLDAMLENCIFYISPVYELSHSLGVITENSHYEQMFSGVPPATDIRQRGWHVGSVPQPDVRQLVYNCQF